MMVTGHNKLWAQLLREENHLTALHILINLQNVPGGKDITSLEIGDFRAKNEKKASCRHRSRNGCSRVIAC